MNPSKQGSERLPIPIALSAVVMRPASPHRSAEPFPGLPSDLGSLAQQVNGEGKSHVKGWAGLWLVVRHSPAVRMTVKRGTPVPRISPYRPILRPLDRSRRPRPGLYAQQQATVLRKVVP